ncbi:replication initiator protein [Microviridae sp.]|nr:replication initiator protein [Microviridae sp.]
MTCYNPLLAYKEDGKVVFEKPFPFAKGFNIPCGQCIGCRLNYSRQWAIRCIHEAQMHKNNCFITLTFSPEALAARKNPQSLEMREFQLFMKRLRKKYGEGIRFFHCGEYGEKNKRPHYHALIFGHDFDDKQLWNQKNGIKLYISDELKQLWPYGFSTIGDVTFESAAYCARYVLKKVTGDAAADHYTYTEPETGEVINIKPEYCTMSRKPGIGYNWLQKFKTDVYPHDYVVIRDKIKVKPPRYYDSLLSEAELKAIKTKRIKDSPETIDKYDENMDRLWVKEECKIQTVKQLIRQLD